jgi:hypothetical protein
MTRLDRIELAIKKGFTYDKVTGKVFGVKGREITNKNTYGYIQIRIVVDKKVYQILSHHFAYYIIHNKIVEQIDHINGDRSDNRIDNLREVTNQQNTFNRKGTKGYSLNSGKFMAQIRINNKQINLGRFNTEEEAREAYLDAKKIYHII